MKKYKGRVTYTKLDKEIKRDCAKAKEIWANKKCEKIEGVSKGLETKEMFREIKYSTKDQKQGAVSRAKMERFSLKQKIFWQGGQNMLKNCSMNQDLTTQSK